MLNIPRGTIAYDYVALEAELRSDRKARMQDLKVLGLGEEFAGTPSDFVTQISQHINNKYEGLLPYFVCIGFKPDLQEVIKSSLEAMVGMKQQDYY